ncbi:MAG: preprotein translocase subunit YajC [Dissulfurimicrobium sp.]|uniref:preprotein translocase subunit YajC n=1 Tax=Dissulfurimicrobium TaxID=1769732 RepID=UPI001EDB3A68|nr:preprotein translocase subunit YajC [Dissulfurimicrobium hydrothermale]UKL14546.1 preprotein translocase subunit YajC [Dissulfurimicrobium hydrothermale]
MLGTSIAFAMGASSGGAGEAGNPLLSLLPLVIIFFIFYFLLIRPQQKRANEHKKFLDSLEKGQEVTTAGGIIGRITGLTEKVVTLDVGDNIKIKVARSHISGPGPSKTEAAKQE